MKCSLLIFTVFFLFKYSESQVTGLGNVQHIGQLTYNQAIGAGLQVGDSLIVYGPVQFDKRTIIWGKIGIGTANTFAQLTDSSIYPIHISTPKDSSVFDLNYLNMLGYTFPFSGVYTTRLGYPTLMGFVDFTTTGGGKELSFGYLDASFKPVGLLMQPNIGVGQFTGYDASGNIQYGAYYNTLLKYSTLFCLRTNTPIGSTGTDVSGFWVDSSRAFMRHFFNSSGSGKQFIAIATDSAYTIGVSNNDGRYAQTVGLGMDTTGRIGIGTNAPSSSSALDIESTTGGFLFPQMTSKQRLSISSPKEGLTVYDLTYHASYQWNGSAWVKISAE